MVTTWTHDMCGITVIKTGNVIRLTGHLVKQLRLKAGSKISFTFENDIVSLFESEDGFQLKQEGPYRLVVYNSYLAARLRDNLNQSRDYTFKIIGTVHNNEFNSMEIITYSTAKLKHSGNAGAHARQPFININKNILTTNISSSAKTLLMLGDDDKILLGREGQNIYIATGNEGFNVTKVKYGSCTITSRAFAKELMEFFKITNESISHRFAIKKESIFRNSITFYEILKPEKS